MTPKPKIYLYTSDIAAFIGKNPYDIVTPFERLWKRCDPTGYTIALERSKDVVEANKVELIELAQQELMLDDDLQNKRITKRQFTLQKNKLLEKKTQVQQDINVISDQIDDIDLSQQQKLERAIGKEVVEQIISADVETEDKRKQVNKIMDTTDLAPEKLHAIKKHAESFINKSHGTIKEVDAISMYEKKFGVTLDVSQQLVKYFLEEASKASNYDWYICGKMDGVYVDSSNPERSYIVEVKNRTRGFFSSLRDYEKVQIQAYMLMRGMRRSQLVEKYNSRIRVTEIYYDSDFVNDIETHLSIFIKNTENNFLQNAEVKAQYINFDNDKKRAFIRRLYLNEIMQSVNDKIEHMNTDCMIDDLD